MFKIEVILGVIASSLAILAFMARTYSNLRKGRRLRDARRQEESRDRREISSGEE